MVFHQCRVKIINKCWQIYFDENDINKTLKFSNCKLAHYQIILRPIPMCTKHYNIGTNMT